MDFIFFLNELNISPEEVLTAISENGSCFRSHIDACSNFELKNLDYILKTREDFFSEKLTRVLINLGGGHMVDLLDLTGAVKKAHMKFLYIIEEKMDLGLLDHYLPQIVSYLSNGNLSQVEILLEFIDVIDFLLKIDREYQFEEYFLQDKLVLEEVGKQIEKLMQYHRRSIRSILKKYLALWGVFVISKGRRLIVHSDEVCEIFT